MASDEKLTIKEVLAAVDTGEFGLWDELSEEQRKSVGFWLLTRYVGSVKGNRDKQELAIFKLNEYYNKNWNVIQKDHKKLLWLTLCLAANTGKIEWHEYIKPINAKAKANKTIKFLQTIYPNMKQDEVELLAGISTKKELKELAEEYGYDSKDVIG
jgi:hypothetical protein